jgi:hypothetical protein
MMTIRKRDRYLTTTPCHYNLQSSLRRLLHDANWQLATGYWLLATAFLATDYWQLTTAAGEER